MASGDDVDDLHGVQACWLRMSRPSLSGQDTLQRPSVHEGVTETFCFSIEQAAVASLVYSIAMTGQRRS